MSEKDHLDLTDIPNELHLILELLKKDNPVDFQEVFIGIDWNLFIDLAMHHRLYPVLYNKLQMLGEKEVPPYVMETLSREYKRNTFQMLHFSAEMGKLSKLFSNHQIRLLFLKGPTLGHDLYGDISFRTSGDLDVLVPINQLKNAENILLEQGYKKDDYIKTVLNDWKWRHHHVAYFHPKKGIKLEVHWRLNPGPAKEPSFDQLWKRRCRSNLINSPIFTLGNEDLFFFLVSHGARHGWSRLRWLLDIHQLLNKTINWHDVHILLKRHHSLHIGGQSIILASQLLDKKISNEIKSLIINKKSKNLAKQAVFYFEQMVNLHTDPVPIDVASYHKRYLFTAMSIQHKFFFLMSFLYPYPEDAETLPLPKRLHFLYFPLRPLLWAWRKTQKNMLFHRRI